MKFLRELLLQMYFTIWATAMLLFLPYSLGDLVKEQKKMLYPSGLIFVLLVRTKFALDTKELNNS